METSSQYAELVSSRSLQEGEDIVPLSWEIKKPNMSWETWNEEMRLLNISGATLESTNFIEGRYMYKPWNSNTMVPAHSFSVRSTWNLSKENDFSLPETTKVQALFPTYDGIGFWIGKRRREVGVEAYSRNHERAILRISAMGALGIQKAFIQPENDGAVYRAVLVPGRIHDENGAVIESSTTQAMQECGLDGIDYTYHDKSFRLYGDLRTKSKESEVTEQPYTPHIASLLIPALQRVSRMLGEQNSPPEDSY